MICRKFRSLSNLINGYRYFSDNCGKNVYIETYGCQMNFNDSEIALSILNDAGYQRVTNVREANVALLMTCAIREGAEQKIWGRLSALGKQKRHGHFKIGLLGCMAERLKQKLLEDKSSPVDVVCGPDAYRDLPRLLEEAKLGNKGMNVALSLEETYADVRPVRLCGNDSNHTLVTSAYVSIMRGCDNMCTYCIVPFTRGRERSRPIDSIVEECKRLVEQGVREVVLLGQNVNSYRDLSKSESTFVTPQINSVESQTVKGFSTVYKPKVGGRRFAELLNAVSQIHPDLRIRFTSPHPKDFPDDVLYAIRDIPNITNMLHLPAQSGSSSVLHNMGRGYTRETYLQLVQHVRNIIPDVGLTSDFISGFCGESEQDHKDTLSLIEEVQYNFVYCFPYSMREKTRAFHRLQDDVEQSTKLRRHQEMLQVFRGQSLRVNERMIGQVQLVLVDTKSKRSEDRWIGRNEANTKVIFDKRAIPNQSSSDSTDHQIPGLGEYVAVKITDANSQTLRAEPLYRTSISEFYKKTIHDNGEEGCSSRSVAAP